MPPIVADTTPLNYLVLIEAAEVLPRHRDDGERDAIALAEEQQVTFLLMDERDGAAAARARKLKVIGTLGVLDIAAAHGWIDLQDMFGRLRQTTFRSPQKLMATMLEQDAQRKTRAKG